MKIKVIHIISSMQLGGVEKGINLSISQLNNFCDYKVMTLTNSNSFYDLQNANYFIFSKKKYVLSALFSSIKSLKKEKPLIIISSLWKSAVISLFYKIFIDRKVKLVAFIHNETYFHFVDAFFNKMLIKKSTAIACDSSNTLEVIKKNNPTDKKYFIIPYIFFSKQQHVINLPNLTSEIKFLYAGRLNEVKNLEAVIDFFGIFNEKNRLSKLYVYGEGDTHYILKLKEAIKRNNLIDKVSFEGIFNSAQTSSVYQQHHFYVQFSKNEGMAMSVVDAMVNGVIPICTPVGEIRNYVLHQKNGFVIKNNPQMEDYLMLCDQLNNIIANPQTYESMSNNCYDYFRGRKNYIESFVGMIKALN